MTHVINSEGLTHPKESFEMPVARYHYLDNLRALAMFAGIIFHAALAYSPLMHNLWFTAASDSSAVIDVLSFFTHLFRMPIFFLVSGFFAIMLIQKRGIKGFLKNRFIRILLPFLIFFPILLIAVMSVIGWALGNVENLSPMMSFIKMMQNVPDAPPPPLTTMHLWFLFNLFLFGLVTATLYRFNFFKSRLVNYLFSAKMIMFILPLCIVPALITQTAPHPAPEKFYPELWSFGFYGIFFILGCVIFLKQNLLDELASYKNIFLLVSLFAYSFFYFNLPEVMTLEQIMTEAAMGVNIDLTHILVAIAEAYIAVFMTLYCLIIARNLFNKQNKILRLLSDSSYWIYLIHLPLLFFIQFLLADRLMNMWFEFFLATFLTLIIGLLSYLLMVKWTPIGWLLNGRRNVQVIEKSD